MFYEPDLLNSFIAVYFSYYLQTTLAIATFTASDFDEYGDFDSTDASLGMRLEALFFVPPNETIWSIWEETCEWYSNGSAIKTEFFDGVTKCNFELVDDIVLIESWTHGRIKQDHREGYHNQGFLTAYNKTTGVLLGLRSKGTFYGMVLGNYIVDSSSELHLELASFDLPEFSLYTTNSTPSLGIALPLASTAFVLCCFFRKKKR
jgi:hypothetical protein